MDPNPFVVEPLQLPHKQTFILLHGRGSTGEKFGHDLLGTQIAPRQPSSSPSPPPAETTNDQPTPFTLRKAFPNARFVFPTAARSRATIYKRSLTHQWFDNWKLDPPATEREELQIPGLHETTAGLHALLRKEIDRVPDGARNIVFGGLSQGCAASLTAMLLWEGQRVGAVVGMCGWLPFAERLMEQIGEKPLEHEDDLDPFTRDDESEEEELALSPAVRAARWLAEELDLQCTASPPTVFGCHQTPFFLGHGVQDDRVSVVLGRRASQLLTKIRGGICWKEYHSLGHWYSGQMLRDIVDFVHRETEWSP